MHNADALTDLGRRAVACPRFRWSPGMLAIVPPANNGATGYTIRITEGTGPVNSARAFPDLADAATIGALLGLVREAWPGCYAEPNGAPEWDGIIERERDSWWRVYGFGRIPRPLGYGPTEAAALVAALEAASRPPAPKAPE